MAVGRIKDPVLKVFSNDYPTPYVHNGSFLMDTNVKLAEMGLVYAITFTFLTWPPVIYLLWMLLLLTQRCSMTAQMRSDTRRTTSVKERA
jgi:hypothetical protein